MNYIENIIYSFNFLLNKYLGFTIIENTLNWFENKMIHKYISRKEIPPTTIPIINADELTNKNFIILSNNYRNPVLIKGFLKETNAVKNWNISLNFFCSVVI